MFGLSLFNPWVLLGLVVSFLGVAFIAHHEGDASGSLRVQTAWDHANAVATEVRAKRIASNAAVLAANQKAVDAGRTKDAKTIERMRGNLVIALNGLRDRPTRASAGIDQSGAGTAGARPDQRSTGAGLYGDDSVFLTWKADAAQRIRVQRDACYRDYAQAQASVAKLQCQ